MYSVQIVPPLYLLQTLVVFAEQENLVQTAERLGLTQPTVSRQLQQLEELFTQPLFTQQGRNKVLTDYGQALVKELKPRFTDLERVFQKIDQVFSSPEEITLRIGGLKEALNKYFSDLSFEGSLELVSLSNSEVRERFQDQSLDLSVTTEEINSAEITSKRLESATPVLAIPKKWATDVESARDWAQVCSKHPVAVFSKDRPYLIEFEKKYQIEARANFTFNDWESLEERVHQQKSWAIIPSNFLRENHGYKVLPLGNLFEAEQLFFSYRKELLQFEWMKTLISEIL